MEEIKGDFWMWALLGLISMLLSVPRWEKFRNIDPNESWYSVGLPALDTIFGRARKALSDYRWLDATLLFWPSIVISIALCLAHIELDPKLKAGESLLEFAGIFTGSAVFFTFAYWFDLRRLLLRNWEVNANMGAKFLARLRDTGPSTKLLIETSQRGEMVLRMAAIAGLRELGTSEAKGALKNLCSDQHELIAGAANKALRDIEKASKLTVPISVQNIESLIADYLVLQKQLPKVYKFEKEEHQKVFQECFDAIDKIVYSQLILRRSFPDVYCSKCYQRAEWLYSLEWSWVRCVNCKDVVDLVPHIAHVTGQIGEDEPWQLQDGHLKVRLWNDASTKARNADMDALKIIGGSGINYDWAVSAVVEKLRNENQAFGKDIRVRLVDNPALDHNTLRLLKDLDPQFRIA